MTIEDIKKLEALREDIANFTASIDRFDHFLISAQDALKILIQDAVDRWYEENNRD